MRFGKSAIDIMAVRANANVVKIFFNTENNEIQRIQEEAKASSQRAVHPCRININQEFRPKEKK